MIIKSIKLENIRSYTNKEVKFELGSTLLSGDIGSGKSTILLAMDFALFGLSKGIITGEALLRHGEKNGSVELCFKIDEKEIRIKRNLKRGASSVSQDNGYLMINGDLINLSPVELKQRILELLNYPSEILTKKSLIYRYTVYTPQEEMKTILLGKKEDRLDTLRKVFNIDKYKRIKENSRILSSELRGRIKGYEFSVGDLEVLKENKVKKVTLQNELGVKLNNSNGDLVKVQENVRIKKEEVDKIDEKIKLLNEFKKEFEINELNLKNNNTKFEDNKTSIDRLNNEVLELSKEELKEIDIDVVYKNLVSYRGKLGTIEEELLGVRKSLNESKYAYMDIDKLIKEVSSLNKCPVCFQNVSSEHKHSILGKEEIRVKDLSDNIKIYTKKENDLVRDLEVVNEGINELNDKKANYEVIKIKLNNLKEKKDNVTRLVLENESISKLVNEINNKNLELKSKIEGIIVNTDVKKELNVYLEEEKRYLLLKNSLENELRVVNEEIVKLGNDIINKEKIRENLFKVKKLKSFIDEDFSRLVETMERKVMLRVHNDFNELFVKWFDILVDDGNMSVSLDEEFSVVIEQSGYNVDYLFLSGGEKTAGALAYRLALNQVINNLIVNIKTKDLIILDEPTDGFSEDQLDRVRLVLDELDVKQVILVSHESKIESFVTNVISLVKKEGVSEVI